jgi:hypothetical protein
MTFRFDHKGTRDKISYWFAGKVDSSWKAEYTKCEEFMEKLGHSGTNFAKNGVKRQLCPSDSICRPQLRQLRCVVGFDAASHYRCQFCDGAGDRGLQLGSKLRSRGEHAEDLPSRKVALSARSVAASVEIPGISLLNPRFSKRSSCRPKLPSL